MEDQQRRMDEQQRRMEEQERRIEEQARDASKPEPEIAAQMRRLEEQQRQIAEQSRNAATPAPALAEQERRLEEQQRQLEEQLKKIAEHEAQSAKSRLAEATPDQPAKEDRIAPTRYDFAEEEDEEYQEEDLVTVQRQPASGRKRLPLPDDLDSDDGWEEERFAASPRTKRALGSHEEDTGRRRSPGPEGGDRDFGDEDEYGEPDRHRMERRAEGRPQNGARTGRARTYVEDEPEEERPSHRSRNGFGSRVYEEYLDLLGEAEELDAEEEDGKAELSLDINLLSSLTRWASIAKRRVGGARLIDILDLYTQSGHLKPRLRELLVHLSDMVEDVPAETSRDAQDCVDLLSHLHGILAGGVAIYEFRHAKAGS
jgi:hypothetical protein